ncbi:hypothetical protein [Vibrio sp. qd031]|uniref:hypothetical protein n=1 Tax=Vibrio sp. qd031 TaxID=1603038 RepID=UPI001553DFD1|nr:hypothetical protein [Vibrio sp. qd031]
MTNDEVEKLVEIACAEYFQHLYFVMDRRYSPEIIGAHHKAAKKKAIKYTTMAVSKLK